MNGRPESKRVGERVLHLWPGFHNSELRTHNSELLFPFPSKLPGLFKAQAGQDTATELCDQVVDGFGPVIERRDDREYHRSRGLRAQHVLKMDAVEGRVANRQDELAPFLQADVRGAR